MANNITSCVKKPDIDQKAQTAIDAADPVLTAANPSVTDLKNALQLARDTLKAIRSDPHHL